jgi:hypothetical protein
MNATIVKAIVTKDVNVAKASLAKSSLFEINHVFTRSNAGIKFKPYTILDMAILESRGDRVGSPGRQIVDLLRAKGARTYMEIVHIPTPAPLAPTPAPLVPKPPLAVVPKRGIVPNGIRSQQTPFMQGSTMITSIRAFPNETRASTAAAAAAPVAAAAAATPVQARNRRNQNPLRLATTTVSRISSVPGRGNHMLVPNRTRSLARTAAHSPIQTPSTVISDIRVGSATGGKKRRKYTRRR